VQFLTQLLLAHAPHFEKGSSTTGKSHQVGCRRAREKYVKLRCAAEECKNQRPFSLLRLWHFPRCPTKAQCCAVNCHARIRAALNVVVSGRLLYRRNHACASRSGGREQSREFAFRLNKIAVELPAFWTLRLVDRKPSTQPSELVSNVGKLFFGLYLVLNSRHICQCTNDVLTAVSYGW